MRSANSFFFLPTSDITVGCSFASTPSKQWLESKNVNSKFMQMPLRILMQTICNTIFMSLIKEDATKFTVCKCW